METGIEKSETLRDTAREFVERKAVTNTILGVIIFNAITLGLSTSASIQSSIGDVLW